ncbi:ThuA domain-containing protein [Dactylosporangium sp. NPDC051541]|uniref:ThuA domain-containing protein n=1 Tax=Dactylosporangium sp. NPDC051541 TaxID=3363977 RepID=UPI00379DE01B
MRLRILVYSRTTDYRHDSIPAGVAALRTLGRTHRFDVEATEDPAVFDELDRFTAVALLSTSGSIGGPAARAALESFVRAGGGFAGIHGAATTEYEWPFFGTLIGAWFDRHPHVQPARIIVEDRAHASTAHLPEVWTRTDEWYDFRTNPRPSVRVLLRADESSYEGGTMGPDHPLAWCHEHLGGRSFYTALGHTTESYEEPAVLQHLLGGLRWAARMGP